MLVENRDFFHTALAFDAPVWDFRRSVIIYAVMWIKKCGEKTLMICFAVSTEYRRVRDQHTDRHLATT